MFAYLEGRLIEKAPTHILLDVNGVGYEIFIPISSYNRLGEINGKIRILTYYHVREDIQQLYGFLTDKERGLFKLLITVSGIGPKMALALLSGSSVNDIKRAIYKGDSGFLKSIPGIGNKLAERLIVELKGKISEEEEWFSKSEKHRKKEDELIWHDCIQALISLGYRHSSAREALENALSRGASPKNAEGLIKEALKYVSEK